ncbi:hypothetical protein [Proteus mirabilis]|uniref:hypothetical protein n=1 Tax=Proteus mirabilis TaxID=584 RepID=UPI001EFC081F|nr:hypothetical protein [Proteus mirabilis]
MFIPSVKLIEKFKIYTERDFVDVHRPRGKLLSTDMDAISEGIRTPPHIAMIAKMACLRESYSRCIDLKKESIKLNGNIGGQYKTNNSGIQNIKGVLTRSKLTRSSLYNVSKNGSFCWGPSAYDQENFYDPSFRSYVSISINSYSVYAYGDIKPGIFSLETSFKLSRNTANSVDDSTAYFIRPGEIKVTALRSCNVTSSTETNIKFKDQFTSTFTSPTLLDTSPVNSVNVTCTQGGKNYITIKAYNSLVSGNMSGMLLNGTKSNNQSEVYVVASLKNLTNQTCQANDSSAIRFFDGHYIPNMDNIKSFNQTFLFGLCANGKVIADKYSGAVDVSFIVE